VIWPSHKKPVDHKKPVETSFENQNDIPIKKSGGISFNIEDDRPFTAKQPKKPV